MNKSYSNIQTQLKKIIVGITGILFIFYLISCNQEDPASSTIESILVPPAPPLLSVSNYGATIYLDWTVEHFGTNADGSPAEFSSYRVEKKDASQWTTITNLDVNTMSYSHQVEPGTYTYRVTVTNNAIPPQGITSAEVSVTIAAAIAPGTPTAFTASETTASSISLTWESPDAGSSIGGIPATLSGYYLQYKENSDDQWTSLMVSTTSLTISNLIPLTSYDFLLYASNSDRALSQRPAEFSATTISGAAPPAPPLLSVSNYGTTIYLDWTVEHFGNHLDSRPAEFSSYRVEKKDGSQWTIITNLNVNTMSYIHQISIHQVSNTITNIYRVTVTSSTTPPQTSTSAEVSVTIAAATAPGTPTAFTASETTTSSISLTWESPDAGSSIGGVPATIKYFFLQYKLSETEWEEGQEKIFADTVTSYTISNLLPLTLYDLRIYASNDAGLLSRTPGVISNVKTSILVDSVTLSPTIVLFDKVGDVTNLSYTIIPTNASNPKVSWSSDNTVVATVNNNGQVTAVGRGIATITVTTEEGSKTATTTVTVTPTTPKNLNKILPCDKDISVDLTWDASPGATSYEIYRNDQRITNNISTNYYTDTGLTPGTPYTYEVKACVNTWCSKSSESLEIVTTNRGLTIEHIIASGNVPTDMALTNYDERSRDIFSLYNDGASIVTRYVKKGGAGDGSSFIHPAGDIKSVMDGITDASENKIYVVLLDGGTYPITNTMSMKNHVAIVGGVDECLGFSDTATALDGMDRRPVFTNYGLNHTALLYGVTITNGRVRSPDKFGGGMYNNKSSPSLTRVVFSKNVAEMGGGLANRLSSSPILKKVTFNHNHGENYGGGIYNDQSSPKLTEVVFHNNQASDGGGMYNNFSSSPNLIGVTFSTNTASQNGGGMYNFTFSSPNLIGVTFSGNTANNNGGGMYNNNNYNNSYQKGSLIINGIFWGNTASSGPEFYFHNEGTGQEKLRIYNSIVAGGTGNLISGNTYTNTINQGGFVSGDGSAPVVISFSSITNANPKLGTLTDNGGSVLPHHAIPSNSPAGNSPAVDQGLYVKRKGTDYYYSKTGEKDKWYKNSPDLSGTLENPPDDAEDLTAVDATGHTRTDRPDLGAYEYRDK